MSRHRSQHRHTGGGLIATFFIVVAFLAFIFWPLAVAAVILCGLVVVPAFLVGFFRVRRYARS